MSCQIVKWLIQTFAVFWPDSLSNSTGQLRTLRAFAENRAPRFLRSEAKLRTPRRRAREPKLVAEITYLAWTVDSLLRHAVYIGPREEKPAEDVRREAARVR
jgi:ATP-dependent DNA ligase